MQLTAIYATAGTAVLATAALASFYHWNKSDILSIIGLVISIAITVAASNGVREVRKLRIGIVIPSMRPFHKELRRGIYESAKHGSYTIFDPYNERDSPEEDLTTFGLCLTAAIRDRADGLIVCAPAVALAESSDLQQECEKFASKGGHLVFIESVPRATLLDSIRFATTLTSDSDASAELIANYIAQIATDVDTNTETKRPARILVLPGPTHSRPAARRLDALRRNLDNYHIDVVNTLSWSEDECRAAALKYLRTNNPDIICCGNDDMATGACNAVKASKKNVAYITGHDGLFQAIASIADPFSPFRATVRLPPSAFGSRAVTAFDVLPVRWKLLLPSGFSKYSRSASDDEKLPVTGANLVTEHNARLYLD
ncbi:substrate-binding domain-containing protein [Mycobacterium sp. DSM 3803]|nr:substrate-binding domain-containing protein [Mycobacterium sp. DSM 3803]